MKYFYNWQDGFISCSLALIGAAITGLWLYNVFNLKKTVDGQINFVYDGPSQCSKGFICKKNYPDFLLLYIAAVSISSCIGFYAG